MLQILVNQKELSIEEIYFWLDVFASHKKQATIK